MVDCTQGGAHRDLMQRYGVSGFPTVLFTNPQGEKVGELRGRDPASVKRQIEDTVRQHARPVVSDMTLDEGLSLAREQRKLLVVVVAERDTPDMAPLLETILAQPMAEVRARFLWIRRPFAGERGKPTDEAKALGARRAPTLIVLDPWADGEDRELKKLTAFRSLKRDLEKAAEEAQERSHPPAADAPPATPPADAPPATPPAGDAPATPPR